jgi:hypothetical protein
MLVTLYTIFSVVSPLLNYYPMQTLFESNSNIYGSCVLGQACQGAHSMGSLICFKPRYLT